MSLELLDLSKDFEDCSFFLSEDHLTFYKVCKNPLKYSLYQKSFDLEYQAMTRLALSSPGESYFPRYRDTGDINGQPFISMDYISGKNLEEILRSRKNPAFPEPRYLFDRNILFHICSQVIEALTRLYQSGILYLDLFPGNILVRNKDFDIQMIDFTSCCYLDSSLGASSWPGKRIDFQISSDYPLELTIRKTFLLFFSRLFYSGSENYSEIFFTSCEYGNPNRAFFQREFSNLLGSLWQHTREEEHTARPLSCLSDEQVLSGQSRVFEDLAFWLEKLRKKLDIPL